MGIGIVEPKKQQREKRRENSAKGTKAIDDVDEHETVCTVAREKEKLFFPGKALL